MLVDVLPVRLRTRVRFPPPPSLCRPPEGRPARFTGETMFPPWAPSSCPGGLRREPRPRMSGAATGIVGCDSHARRVPGSAPSSSVHHARSVSHVRVESRECLARAIPRPAVSCKSSPCTSGQVPRSKASPSPCPHGVHRASQRLTGSPRPLHKSRCSSSRMSGPCRGLGRLPVSASPTSRPCIYTGTQRTTDSRSLRFRSRLPLPAINRTSRSPWIRPGREDWIALR